MKPTEQKEEANEQWRLWGELFLDDEGEAHFICHTKDDDFAATKVAFEKFIGLLQSQIRNEQQCPFYNKIPDGIAYHVDNAPKVETGFKHCDFCHAQHRPEDATALHAPRLCASCGDTHRPVDGCPLTAFAVSSAFEGRV